MRAKIDESASPPSELDAPSLQVRALERSMPVLELTRPQAQTPPMLAPAEPFSYISVSGLLDIAWRFGDLPVSRNEDMVRAAVYPPGLKQDLTPCPVRSIAPPDRV